MNNMTPNNAQILSAVRWLLTVGGTYLVARGMSQDMVDDLSTWIILGFAIVPPFAAFVWGLFVHTDAAKLAAVDALPKDQIVGVVVAPTATNGIRAAATNPALTKVMLATPAITAAIAAAPVTQEGKQ